MRTTLICCVLASVGARSPQSESRLAESRTERAPSTGRILDVVRERIATAQKQIKICESSFDAPKVDTGKIDAAKVDTAKESLKLARAACADLREILANPEAHDVIVASETRFAVEESQRATIPELSDWLEVHVGDIKSGLVSISVRTIEGDVVHPTKRIAQGESVTFPWRNAEVRLYADKLVYGPKILWAQKKTANLRVVVRPKEGNNTAASERPEPKIAITETTIEEVPASGPGARHAPIMFSLLSLVGENATITDKEFDDAESALARGDAAAFRESMQSIRAALVELRKFADHIESMDRFARERCAVLSDLSIIKIKATEVRQPKPVTEWMKAERQKDPLMDKYLRYIELCQTARGTILDARTIGKRYATLTKVGGRQPNEMRSDFEVGGTIEFENSPELDSSLDLVKAIESGGAIDPAARFQKLEQDYEYWVCITPETKFATGLFARAIKTNVVFAIRARE